MAENFHDKIANLCISHCNNLPKTGKPTKTEWTVLSCIVKQNTAKDHFEVVSLGTGTKCIGKHKMSAHGDILNDSHAEIICRRAFLRYLYKELNSNSEIFTFDCDISKFSLRSNIVFHFFTSHVPCGDAAIFPKQSCSEFGEIIAPTNVGPKRPAENDASSKAKQIKLDHVKTVPDADIFRTGAKCLPEGSRQDLNLGGSEFHTVGAIRTKPGRGDPTSSVSCSDKLSKWCYLGVQGALLSLLLSKPIYLASFTIIGQTPYCEQALRRALFDRFGQVELSLPYKQIKMMLGQSTLSFNFCKTDERHPCPSSIAWCKTCLQPLEVAVEGKKQGVTKKKQNTPAGRLQISKIELFRAFLDTIKQHKLGVFGNKELSKISYSDAKCKAKEYQKVWEILKLTVFKVWTVKDKALLQFTIDE